MKNKEKFLNEIVVYEKKIKITPTELFTPTEIDKVLAMIKDNVENLVQDISTKEGRQQIKSEAMKIAKTKVYIDNLGKDLTDEWTTKTKLVNTERKKSREFLDDLKVKIRKPLTDWENKDKDRIEECKRRIILIENYAGEFSCSNSSMYDEELKKVKELFDHEWSEFKFKAETVFNKAIENIKKRKATKLKAEQDEIELENLRKEKEERDRKDREEKIAKEAEDKAKKEAEEKAVKEKERVEAEKKKTEEETKEKEDKLKKEKEEAEKKAKNQEELRKQAERDAKVDKKRIERETHEKFEREREELLKKERARVELEKKKTEEEAKKREADTKHHAKINNEVLDDIFPFFIELNKLTEENISDKILKEICKYIITGIAKKQIRHLSIRY